MELLNKSSVPTKYAGDGLSHLELNSINSTANSCVDSSNYLLKSFCNLNVECNDYTRTFSLEEAIKQVPLTRRSPGLKIRFLNSDNKYVEYIYSYSSANQEEDWNNTLNWDNCSLIQDNIIDGGEF